MHTRMNRKACASSARGETVGCIECWLYLVAMGLVGWKRLKVACCLASLNALSRYTLVAMSYRSVIELAAVSLTLCLAGRFCCSLCRIVSDSNDGE